MHLQDQLDQALLDQIRSLYFWAASAIVVYQSGFGR